MTNTKSSRQRIRHCATQVALVACIAVAFADTAHAQYPANPPYYFVTGVYQGVLGRQPDPGGWMFWIGSPPNAPGSLNGLNDSQVTNYFLTSQEYCNYFGIPSSQCPNSSSTPTDPPTNAQFLSLLYTRANNEPNASSTDPNYNTWLNAIPSDTRATVVDDFIAPTYNGQKTTFDQLYGSFANSYCTGSITPTTFSPSNVILGAPTTMSFTYSNSDYCPGDFQYGVIAVSTQGGVNQNASCQITWYGASGGSVSASDSSSVCVVSAAPGVPIVSFSGSQATVTFNLTLVASYFTGTQEAYSYAYDNHGVGTGSYTNLPTLTVQALTMYSISGTISLYPSFSLGNASGTPLSGITVALSGTSSNLAQTGSNGSYSFTVPAGGTYTVAPQSSAYFFSPSSTTFQNLGSNTTQPFPAYTEDCYLDANGASNTNRTTGNQVAGTGTIYPNQIIGNWSVTITTTLLFTPTGGTEGAVSANSYTFSWDPGTPPGVASTETIDASSALQPYGAGSYRTSAAYSGSCGGVEFVPNGSPVYSGPLAIQRPTISPPAGSPYPAGEYAIWYLGGQPSQSGYYTSTTLAGADNIGACGTCNPVYNWAITQSPNGATVQPVAFGSPKSTVTTVTSQTSSDGQVYDTGIVFSVDGFLSAEFMMNLDTPASASMVLANQVANPTGCQNPNVNGGYDNQYNYAPYDLWGYNLTPIVVNEENNQFQDVFNGIVGWHYAASFVYDDVGTRLQTHRRERRYGKS